MLDRDFLRCNCLYWQIGYKEDFLKKKKSVHKEKRKGNKVFSSVEEISLKLYEEKREKSVRIS